MVIPAPPDLRKVPELLKTIPTVKAENIGPSAWASHRPLLFSTLSPLPRMEPPAHATVPALFSRQPGRSWSLPVVMFNRPPAAMTSSPGVVRPSNVPADQLNTPLTVFVPNPSSVPPSKLNWPLVVTLPTPFSVNVTAFTTKVCVLLPLLAPSVKPATVAGMSSVTR